MIHGNKTGDATEASTVLRGSSSRREFLNNSAVCLGSVLLSSGIPTNAFAGKLGREQAAFKPPLFKAKISAHL